MSEITIWNVTSALLGAAIGVIVWEGSAWIIRRRGK